MNKEKLDLIRESRLKEISLRNKKQDIIKKNMGLSEDGKIHVMVCGDTGCQASESLIIKERLHKKVQENKLEDKVEIHQTGCVGRCEVGPNIVVYPQGIFYSGLSLEDIDEIVDVQFKNGEIIERLLFDEAKGQEVDDQYIPVDEVGFYKNQVRIALANCGKIDPENIDDYIAYDGYKALYNVLHMDRDQVIQTVKDSGLRGRGGAGFPTGDKWKFTKDAKSQKKYVACNADEGNPGAFMDRSILEGDPHSIIEAMAIAAYAIGADEGVIYIRAEYPIAVDRIKIAIEQAEEYGLLGQNIFGTDFNFTIDIRLGAGAFVCGEETALIESVEGKRGIPRNKPLFPAQRGIWNKPTLINNVETFANIPRIFINGADWFSSIGTENSKGTKVFSLGGKVKHTGPIEVPMGMTFREIVYDIGGGIPNNKNFKAIQTGGPSGGCIPEQFLDTKVDFESLKQLGSMMGSGGMIVIDEDTCIVDLVKFYLDFIIDESCGKCSPCRIGTKRLHELLEKLSDGTAEEQDLIDIKELAKLIKDTSACGLGQSAPNPVLSTLEYFLDEYFEHVYDKKCRAHVCKGIIEYRILEDKCIGCTKCARNCPVQCITGSLKHFHYINQDQCIKCDTCRTVCPVGAVVIE